MELSVSVLTLQFLIIQMECGDSYHYSKEIEHLLNVYYILKRKKEVILNYISEAV